jgi:hypothetical protein
VKWNEQYKYGNNYYVKQSLDRVKGQVRERSGVFETVVPRVNSSKQEFVVVQCIVDPVKVSVIQDDNQNQREKVIPGSKLIPALIVNLGVVRKDEIMGKHPIQGDEEIGLHAHQDLCTHLLFGSDFFLNLIVRIFSNEFVGQSIHQVIQADVANKKEDIDKDIHDCKHSR